MQIQRILKDEFYRGFAPDPMLSVDEWANRHRMLSSVASAEPGRWSTQRTPYLAAIMDAQACGAQAVKRKKKAIIK